MNKQTLFIADLHLSSRTTKTNKLFLKFLETIPKNTDALYILGDIFKFWIGDDDRSKLNEKIKQALKNASSRTKIFLMPGNRDFLLGESFAKESGCTLIPDHHVIDLYGTKTVLTHGDLLCTKDSRYQTFRRFIRFSGTIKLFLMLPLLLRLWLAKNMQKHSSKTKAKKNPKLLTAQLKPIKKLLIDTQTTQIIHGHVHIEEVEELKTGCTSAKRISLGEWLKKGSVLYYPDTGNFELKTFDIDNKH